MRAVFALATLALAGGVDATEFRYTRSLPAEVARGQAAFEPDGLLLAHAKAGLADLRIVDSRGGVVPWRRVPEAQVGPAPADILNSGRRGARATALVDVGLPRRVYERAELHIAGSDFVGRVTVLGSDRRSGPFTRLSTTTVYDVSGAQSARSTTVVFPPTDFRFLELRATGVGRILGATVFAPFERPRLVRRRHGVLGGVRNRGAASVLTLDLGVPGIPVTRLEIRADGTRRYDRPLRVEGTNDRRSFALVGAGRMTRAPGLISPPLELAARFRYLRVTIDNGDDPPLRRVVTETYGPSFAVMVEPGHPGPLRMLYGARGLAAPSYEFARLPAERPRRLLDPSRLPPERLNPAFATAGEDRSFFERNEWLVQAALVVAALVVGVAALLTFRRRAA